MTYTEKLKDPRWQKKRLEVLEAREWKCQICGNTRDTLHVHHEKYTGEPWEIANSDLCVLCEDCHKLSHDLNINPSSILYYKQLKDNHPEPHKHEIFWDNAGIVGRFVCFSNNISQEKIKSSKVYFFAYLQAEDKLYE